MGSSGIAVLLIISSVAVLPTLEATCTFDVEGVIAEVFTPVDDDGSLALDVIAQYAQYLKDRGVDGVLVAATYGEGPTLNVSENKELLDAWMEAAPPLDLYVLSSVGAVPLPDAVEMTKYSKEIGVDAIVAMPEIYYRAQTAEELVYYMEFISEAADDTPVLYDHIPRYTEVYVDMERFLELATERLPNFRGIKSDVFETSLELRTKVTGEQRIFISDYRFYAPAIYMGFTNFVSNAVNLFPSLMLETLTAYQRGNRTLSRARYQRLADLMDIIVEEGNNEIAARKAAMPIVTGLDMGPVRDPIVPLTEEEEEELEQNLRDENVRIIRPANEDR